MIAKLALFVAACLLLASPTRAQEALSFSQFTLPNGLEIIVIPNHRVPAVNHTIWYRAGASDDPAGKSGLAHYLEHMMFQGTPTVAAGEYSKRVANLGGKQNAFTTRDYTGYYITIAKEHLPEAMRLEADRMVHLAPPATDFPRERQVILEERRTSLDSKPTNLFGEQMDASLYLNHPYHTAVIGWREEMEGLTAEDVMAFYRRWYHPNNALVIVSGDVTVEEVKKLAAASYGKIPKVPVPPRLWRREPAHIAARSIQMRHPNVAEPRWQRSYLAPSFGSGHTEQVLPLFFLNHLLGGGQNSRLYHALVTEHKLATDISTDYVALNIGPGKFTIVAQLKDASQRTALEQVIQDELARLQKDGISDEEMARARTTLKAELIYAREGLQPITHILGTLRLIGLPASFFNEWPKQVDRVTKEQILAAARELFVEKQSVTGMLLPQAEAGKNAN